MFSMKNKYTIALYAAVISSMLVASMFAISYVQQQALAQGNQTSSGGGNKTAGAAGSNRSSNATGGGTAANAGTT